MGTVTKIYIYLFFIFSFSQNKDRMENSFILDKELLNEDIQKYKECMIEISQGEYLSGIFDYKYVGDVVEFCGYSVRNIMMKCKKDIIIKVYFEIQNYDNQIVYKIIEKYGYPVSGTLIQHYPILKIQ